MIMIKQNQKYLNFIHVLVDAIIVCISFGMSYFIRFETFFPYSYSRKFFPTVLANETFFQALFMKSNYSKALLYLVPLYLIIYFKCQLYSPKRFQDIHFELEKLIKANIIGIMSFILVYIRFYFPLCHSYHFKENKTNWKKSKACYRYRIQCCRCGLYRSYSRKSSVGLHRSWYFR